MPYGNVMPGMYGVWVSEWLYKKVEGINGKTNVSLPLLQHFSAYYTILEAKFLQKEPSSEHA